MIQPPLLHTGAHDHRKKYLFRKTDFLNYLVSQIYLSIWTSHVNVHVCTLRKVHMVFSFQFLNVWRISDSMVPSFFVVFSSSDRITAVVLLIYLADIYPKRSCHVCLSQLCILCNWKPYVTKQQFCKSKIMGDQVDRQLRWTGYFIAPGVTLNSCCLLILNQALI